MKPKSRHGGALSFLIGVFACLFIVAFLLGTVAHVLHAAYGIQDDFSNLMGSLGSWIGNAIHW